MPALQLVQAVHATLFVETLKRPLWHPEHVRSAVTDPAAVMYSPSAQVLKAPHEVEFALAA